MSALIGHRGLLLGRMAADFASVVAADSPMLWWRMNEGSGAALNDHSGNGRVGTLTDGGGSNSTRGAPSLVGGSDTSTRILAASAYGRSNAVFTAASMATNRTLAIAIKIDSGAAAGTIIGLNDGGNPSGTTGSRDRMLYTNTSGRLVGAVWSGAIRTITSAAPINDGVTRLLHFAFGANNTEGCELYVNGSSIGHFPYVSVDTSGDRFLFAGLLNVTGWPGGGSGTALGVYDEVMVFPSRLTPARILAQASAAGLA